MKDFPALAEPFIDAPPEPESVSNAVINGLGAAPKRLPSSLFYDEAGSRLFDRICELPEYYPTRTETDIMYGSTIDIADSVGAGAVVVEYGSGSSTKTEILLSALVEPQAYLPIDISREHLLSSAARVQRRHPGVSVLPVCADYTRAIPELANYLEGRRSVVYFPGSTIGNFDPDQATSFLRGVRGLVGAGGGLLIGVDLRKDRATLERAYNDSAGVTAEFNLNMLRHINRHLGAVFDLACYHHRAVWNPRAGRIEMHLVSAARQEIGVNGSRFVLEAGEAIVTEHSYKYTVPEFDALARRAGFIVARCWTDPDDLFSVQYLVASP